MLKAHSDKEILIDAYKQFMQKPLENSKEFIDFLMKGSNLIIYGELDQDELNITSAFMEGREETSIYFRKKEDALQNKTDHHKNPYQVFFSKISDLGLQEEKRSKKDFVYGFINDYEQTFAELSKETYFRVGDQGSDSDFRSWKQILPNLPVTDIIISDPYIFNEDDPKRPLSENYLKLLSELANKYNIHSLIIFAPGVVFSKRKYLETESHKILGNTVNFKIISTRNTIEHDRYIFLNYNYINTGSSVNYFDSEGSVSVNKASKIELRSFTNKQNCKIAKDVLRNLKEELERMRDSDTSLKSIGSVLFAWL